jgi:transcriptional regulator NrdR family protein
LFTTTELFDTSSAIRIATNSNSEPFSRDKLFLSIFQACEHLPDAIEVATALTATIIGRLLAAIDSPTVPVHTLTELAAKALKHYDSAAFIRYMSSRASLKNSRSLKALLKD